MTDKDFIEICENSESMRQAATKMNMSFSTFKRKAENLKCYKPNQNWNKGKNSLTDKRIISKHNESLFCENSTASRSYIKTLIIKNRIIEYKCSACGIGSIWNNKYLNIQLDHINGIRNDNRLSNLRFLCPNCHTQTETYCSHNLSKSISFNSYDIEYIIDKLKECPSINKTILELGLKDSSGNRSKLRDIIDKYDIKMK